MTPRATPRASSGWAAFKALAASAFLPESSADSTALMKVRMRPTRAPLISARLALRRMRFLACGVFAIGKSPRVCQVKRKAARAHGPHRRRAPLPARAIRVNQSALAARTIKGRAAALDDSFHNSSAHTGLSFPVIDGEGLGKIAKRAVGTGKVA